MYMSPSITYSCVAGCGRRRSCKRPRATGDSQPERKTDAIRPISLLTLRVSGGSDSSTILILRGVIPRSMGNFPESLSQAMLVGVMLVGRLGVLGGNHLSNTTCLTQVFFKSGE